MKRLKSCPSAKREGKKVYMVRALWKGWGDESYAPKNHWKKSDGLRRGR